MAPNIASLPPSAPADPEAAQDAVRRARGPALPRLVATVLSTALAGLLLGLTAAPAAAEDGFRYWSYFHLNGDAFVFAQTGPGDYTPEDGDVEGWRFGTSTQSQSIWPRVDLEQVDFESVCGEVEAAEGEKRVAVLIDFGTTADASDGAEVPEPVAECAVVPADANGQQTLQAVADVRADGAMVCGIDGYPAKGCGDAVKDAQVPTDEEPVEFALTGSETDDSGSSAAVIGIVAAAIVLLGAGALLTNRRRAVRD